MTQRFFTSGNKLILSTSERVSMDQFCNILFTGGKPCEFGWCWPSSSKFKILSNPVLRLIPFREIGETGCELDLTAPLPDGKILRKHQQEGVKAIMEKRKIIVADEMGTGKLQPVDSNVLTPNGWVKIGTLKIGDKVIGSDGKPITVLGVFPQGKQSVYRTTFSDGSSIESGDEHWWSVEYWKGGKYKHRLTLTTYQLRTKPFVGKLDLSKTTLYIPMLSGPVQFDSKYPLPIGPYSMGAIIANGSCVCCTPNLTTHVKDSEHIQSKLKSEGTKIGAVGIYGNTAHHALIGMKAKLKPLGLIVRSGEKYIPDVFLHSKPDDRISLLHGLMDGDGSISKTQNRLTYSTTSSRLALDVQKLVEGLGGIASVKGYDRRHEGKKVEYNVRIRLPNGMMPFSYPRKLARYNPGKNSAPTRTVVSVKYSRSVESVCISVDAPDHLYVTEHCILTHNTLTTAVAAKKLSEELDSVIVIIAPVTLRDMWKSISEMMGIGALTSIFSWSKIQWPENAKFILIADEAHLAQSSSSQRGKAFKQMTDAKNCVAAILLTGTPLKNGRPSNLYPLLRAVKAPVAKDQGWYEQHFCDAKRTQWSRWDTSGAINLDELREASKPYILRRLKKDCLDLPKMTRVMVHAEVDSKLQNQYKEICKSAKTGWLQSKKTAVETKGFLDKTYQSASLAKVPHVIELIESILEQGHKVVVFSQYLEPVHQVARAFPQNSLVLTGDTPKHKRQGLVDRFQSDPEKRVWSSTAQAGGVGLTLTAACYVILIDRPWTPGDAEQCEARIDRDGQTLPCTSYWIRYGDVDEYRDDKLAMKSGAIQTVLGDESAGIEQIGNYDVADLRKLAERVFR